MGEGGREPSAGATPIVEPKTGLNLTTLRLRPQPKSRIRQCLHQLSHELSHPGTPNYFILKSPAQLG